MKAVSDAERIETVVVGGGQAGLSVGYHLARRGLSFVILDAHERIGDSYAVGLAPAFYSGAVQRGRRHAVSRPGTFHLHQG